MSKNQKLEKSNELVINFSSSEDGTPIIMSVDNRMFSNDLKNKKMVLSYLQIDNTSVPILVTKKLNTLPTPSGFSLVGTGISNISVDYSNGIQDSIGPSNVFAIPQWSPLAPITAPIFLVNEIQSYADPYFYVYDITHFLKIISTSFNALYATTYSVPNYDGMKFLYDAPTNQITMAVPIADFPSTKLVVLNDQLQQLFQFRTVKNAGDYFNKVIWDGTESIDSVDHYVVSSRFVSRQWVSFDTVLIKSTLPVKSVEYQSNQSDKSNSSINYKNIIFSLNTLSSSVNFYPYYIYATDSTDKFLSFTENTYTEDNFKLEVFLFNKRLNLSVPYKLNKDELFSMTLLLFNY